MHLKNVKLFECFAKASLEGSGSGTVLKPFRVDGLQVGLAIASLPGSLRATKAAAKDAKIRTALAKKQAAFLGKVEAGADEIAERLRRKEYGPDCLLKRNRSDKVGLSFVSAYRDCLLSLHFGEVRRGGGDVLLDFSGYIPSEKI